MKKAKAMFRTVPLTVFAETGDVICDRYQGVFPCPTLGLSRAGGGHDRPPFRHLWPACVGSTPLQPFSLN